MSELLSTENMENIEKKLQDYEQEMLGLPQWPRTEAPSCIYANIAVLRNMTPEQLTEAQMQIGQYIIYMQRVINKNHAWRSWARSHLDRAATVALGTMEGYYGYGEKLLIAKNRDELCCRLNAFIRTLSMRIDRLYDVPNNLKMIADTIKDLKFNAIRREKEFSNGD